MAHVSLRGLRRLTWVNTFRRYIKPPFVRLWLKYLHRACLNYKIVDIKKKPDFKSDGLLLPVNLAVYKKSCQNSILYRYPRDNKSGFMFGGI